ncbi:M20 aminoacylase family protein [Sulfitobacter donghicola]|uniref:Amidohydrolase n=1 Tax=Sulfitobacter donghicola DSW-25 = KCTC 12864 = JCM 14565 TaxID=1300350 RepID=A0A073IN10_9RHOB|nr:M20 aminoacylase family protein [Sulfitobacter donghicola]KEJ90881.1 amidohydrolase [Sulfitobacter donghicola DSW-25 = KCTC 12864 = JCM 14565]KIN68161.1 Hippurate hydrolase [Sulfitobacter donghicola DSW-25 = KCTC 12864 = JCM 14565]
MNILPTIADSTDELNEIFRDLHAHPEIGFTETRTSAIVAEKLRAYGVDEVYTGLGKTGVVGLVHGKQKGNRRIGLRADMDALPIHEITELDYASTNDGVMHACGHDGHTTMLLGAAKHLAATRDFDGTAVLIFQPAEEGLGGARQMIADGLFDQFPCDEIYGMHNTPTGQAGKVGITKGAAMAGAAFFDVKVVGKGSHAARPSESKDALIIAASLATEFQTILSRNVAPLETCVLSVTQMHAGAAYNVIPEVATLAGTIRYFKDEVYELAAARMQAICDGFALAHDVTISLELRNVFDVLMNDDALSDAYLEAAGDIVGEENIYHKKEPATGSEDFADMLKVVPGAYCVIGHSGTAPLHNPSFFLDPEILPVGASVMARIVEKRLPLST